MAGPPLQIVVVSGLSGAGKSTAIRVLEDLGFFCIDNLPAVLIPRFLELCEGVGQEIRRIALGIDLRERSFFAGLLTTIEQVRAHGHRLEVLFLDATDEILLRRFNETRRPHHLALGGSVADGVRRERELLRGLREVADRILDTSAWNVHELRAELGRAYVESASPRGLSVFLVSFGFKFGLPPDADMVLDVRCLPNPFFVDELRPLSGLDAAVTRYLFDAPEAIGFLHHARSLLDFLLPLYEHEGKSYFTLAIGCTGGRHRSVAIAERMADDLRQKGVRVQTRHRDIER
ncbi:MAG: RNase adapter RapZ [Candidatus Binatia bacterium]